MLQIIGKLVFELPTPNRRSASPITQGIPSLDHEFRDDTVEKDTLKETTACMTHKILDCLGRLGWVQTKMHVTQGGMDGS